MGWAKRFGACTILQRNDEGRWPRDRYCADSKARGRASGSYGESQKAVLAARRRRLWERSYFFMFLEHSNFPAFSLLESCSQTDKFPKNCLISRISIICWCGHVAFASLLDVLFCGPPSDLAWCVISQFIARDGVKAAFSARYGVIHVACVHVKTDFWARDDVKEDWNFVMTWWKN